MSGETRRRARFARRRYFAPGFARAIQVSQSSRGFWQKMVQCDPLDLQDAGPPEYLLPQEILAQFDVVNVAGELCENSDWGQRRPLKGGTGR